MHYLWVWRFELAAILLSVLIAAVLSYSIGYFIPMVVVILAIAMIRQVLLISRLERWLSGGARGKTPTGTGIWSDIYYHFYRIKKSEKKRKKNLVKIIDRFRKSTDILPDAAVVLGGYNEIEWSNKLAKTVLGVKKSDKGQRIDNLIRAPEFVRFLHGRDQKKTVTLPSPVDAAILLEFRMVSYGVDQRLIIANNVTQQRKMETMRKDFVDNISHELRTPLTVIKGYLETLQEIDDGHLSMLSKSLNQMVAQTERMQFLVDDLLLLSRLETQNHNNQCVNVTQLIKKICLENGVLESNNQRIKLRLEDQCLISGDEQELHSAFTNLINNALKYSSIDTQVKVICKKRKGGLVVDIKDQGEGIATKEISRITERFYRVDVPRSIKISGTGLGLAIVKHVLMRHDAQLEINSRMGEGSRFRCVFPGSRLL